ncbi:MAG: AAA family ATPase [Bacteroidota bacterium]
MEKPLEQMTDAEKEFLKGPVKQVMEVCYNAHTSQNTVVRGKIQVDSKWNRFNSIITFDKEGYKIHEQAFDKSGYDIHNYNERHLVTDTIEYKTGGILVKTNSHIYNDKWQLVCLRAVNADGTMYYRAEYTFNEQGKQTEYLHYQGGENKLASRTVFNYTEKGDQLSVLQYTGDGVLRHETLFTYNDKDQKTEYISRNTDKKGSDYNTRTTYQYNDKGDCILTQIFKEDGTLKSSFSHTYEYDSEGKKIVKPPRPYNRHALKDGEKETDVIDSHGNWIKKTVFFDTRPTHIFERKISYYGEPSENEAPFIHPLTLVIEPETEIEQKPYVRDSLPVETAQWLVSGYNAQAEFFPLLRYYAQEFKELPSVVAFTGPYIEAIALKEHLESKMRAIEIHSHRTNWAGWEQINRYTLVFPGYPYVLHAVGIGGYDEDEYKIPRNLRIDSRIEDKVYLSQFQLLCPSPASGKRDLYFEEELKDFIEFCSLRKKPDKPFINIIEVRGTSFALAEYAVDDDFEIRDLDVNYGYGFEKFHNELMQRFHKSTKGLVLFHGEPGTGKTFYIRHLLRKMVVARKTVIYMPPNMVDHLIEPGFMTFLSNEIKNHASNGQFCVLLIEDAEPLLAKRQEGVRIQGVTNLLNMTDGILNDMLSLQIICTFNVDLAKLDSALLRPGRLIARKEFKPLSELDANLLAQRLGIKHHFTGPATLGEIYALAKNKNTLIHDVEPDKGASTAIDDLI